MINCNIYGVSFNNEGNKTLQLQVIIKDGKFNIYYNEVLLKKLGIKEKDFETLAQKLKEIIDPSLIKEETGLVALYVIKTDVKIDGTNDVEVNQDLQAKSNNKDFPPEICKKVNHALLKDIFIKMGVDEASIDKYIN